MLGRCALLALLLQACGGGSEAGGGDAGDFVPAMRRECDPTQQGCPAGQTCDLVCDALGTKVGCRPAGTLAAGAACQAVSSCAAGTGCFATATASQSCVPYCRTDADCATGRCQERLVVRICTVESPRYPLRFCLP